MSDISRPRTGTTLVWPAAGLVAAIAIAVGLNYCDTQPPTTFTSSRPPLGELYATSRLFVAVGSAPKNSVLRQAARDSWVKWANVPGAERVKVVFFTDQETGNVDQNKAIMSEAVGTGDLVLQNIDTGYAQFAERGMFQIQYALHHFPEMTHFLRIDDDSFLCLRRVLFELDRRPSRQFFWGKYWCKPGRNRADENFMLFSSDVARFISDHAGNLLPYDRNCTLAWNFGFWSHLMNLTIFDDQARLDAQQQYLTEFMHGETLNPTENRQHQRFCLDFVYAHHVRSPEVMRGVFEATSMVDPHLYDIPVTQANSISCLPGDRSITPALHSQTLPRIRIENLDSSSSL